MKLSGVGDCFVCRVFDANAGEYFLDKFRQRGAIEFVLWELEHTQRRSTEATLHVVMSRVGEAHAGDWNARPFEPFCTIVSRALKATLDDIDVREISVRKLPTYGSNGKRCYKCTFRRSRVVPRWQLVRFHSQLWVGSPAKLIVRKLVNIHSYKNIMSVCS